MSVTPLDMTAAERFTLELGFAIMLAALGVGLQAGGWPLWSAPIALAGYLAWTVLYSEAALQSGRWRIKSDSKRFWVALPADSVAPPSEE